MASDDGDRLPPGSVLIVDYPEGESHDAVLIRYPDDAEPWLALGTSHRRSRFPRAEIRWDRHPEWWWLANKPKGVTYFYDYSGMDVPESAWLVHAGEVSDSKLREIAEIVGGGE